MLPHIRTTQGITILVRGRPINVDHTHKQYEDIINALMGGADDKTINDLINKVRDEVERACTLSDKIVYQGGVVTYQGQVLHGYAIDKLISLIQANKDVKGLVAFLEKLQKNPSNQTIENLYQFLEYGSIPINSEGNFLVYKAVRPDYKDIHSGKFDNNIGAVCTMPRRAVNDDRAVTCSHGLHVCSFEYLPHFAHASGHVMVCEVDPGDVVSIPTDYNNTKMRVCKYKVIGEVADYYTDEKHDVLGELEMWDEQYTIEGAQEGALAWTVVAELEDLDDAIEIAEEEVDCGGDNGEVWSAVRVLNASGVLMWHS